MLLRRALITGAVLAVVTPAGTASAKPLHKPTWLSRTAITEYFPVPESWFNGKRVSAPGMGGTHRVDWLYSAKGLSMEGDGVGLDGRRYHIEDTGSVGWITQTGARTTPGRNGWTKGSPFWRAAGYWRTKSSKKPTYPLERGGWFSGIGKRYVQANGITFGSGPSRDLDYYASVAVDPKLIPLGSRVYIPAYKGVGGSNGWFIAEDTGGAIQGRHLDVYRSAPASASGPVNSIASTRVRVFPPGTGGQDPHVSGAVAASSGGAAAD